MTGAGVKYTNPDFQRGFYERLNELRKHGIFCDFNEKVIWHTSLTNLFQTEGRYIAAHSFVLTQRIPKFQQALLGEGSITELLKNLSHR